MPKQPYMLEIVWPTGRRQGLSFKTTRKRQKAAERALRQNAVSVKMHDQLELKLDA